MAAHGSADRRDDHQADHHPRLREPRPQAAQAGPFLGRGEQIAGREQEQARRRGHDDGTRIPAQPEADGRQGAEDDTRRQPNAKTAQPRGQRRQPWLRGTLHGLAGKLGLVGKLGPVAKLGPVGKLGLVGRLGLVAARRPPSPGEPRGPDGDEHDDGESGQAAEHRDAE
ncbi:MAG: hypothetical protein ACLQB1_19255 [Streptosporangiaceae bacterium]